MEITSFGSWYGLFIENFFKWNREEFMKTFRYSIPQFNKQVQHLGKNLDMRYPECYGKKL
jgi:hypothetical protein